MARNFAEAMMEGMEFSARRRAQEQSLQRQNRLADMTIERGQMQMDNANRDQLAQISRGWKALTDSTQKKAYYDRFVVPAMAKMGWQADALGPYDEKAVDNVASQIIAATSGGKADNPYEGLPSDIQSLRFLQQNPDLAQLDMQRRQGGQQWVLADVPDGNRGTFQMERNPYTGEWRRPSYGGPAASSGGGAPSFGIPETDNYVKSILGRAGNIDPNASPETIAAQVLPHLIQQESGGNPNAVSPKGARGYTQVMPATGRDPGFGVQPLQNDSPEENVRFGRDYLTAMIRRYPGRLDQALAAYNAGPGRIPVQGGGPQVAQSGGWGYTPPERSKAQPVRTLTTDEVRSMGFPAGSIVQQDTEGNLKTVYTPKADEAGGKDDGLNDRQRVAVQGVQRNLVQYASALTGLSPDDIKKMTTDEIAQAITSRGGRFVQGGRARILSNLPFGGETAVQVNNSDILSFAQGAGAAWAGYENPTGIITNADRESATAQMPNPYDPPEVQAAKIKNFLELSGWQGAGGGGKNKGSPQPIRVRTPSDYNNLPSGSLYIAPDGSQRRKK